MLSFWASDLPFVGPGIGPLLTDLNPGSWPIQDATYLIK